MNILILNWRDPKNPQAGGAEVVTYEHAKAWVEKGNTVTWVASGFTNSQSQEMLKGVKIVRVGNSLTVHLLAFFYFISHHSAIDIVIDEIHGIPFFTPLYVRKPKIAFIHEVAAEIWDYMYPFPVNRIGKSIERLYFIFYKKIPFWVVAPSIVEELGKYGIARKNCHIILNSITNKTLTNLPNKESNPTYIFVSRLVKMKGIEEIIKAFGFIHKENEKANLWIVGSGDKNYISQLREMIYQYNIDEKVVLFGNVSQEKKLDLLQRAHIILHASIKEGWGLVIIEAASQGTPAVVYDVSGLRDSVKNNQTGIVLSENSPQEMAKQAMMLLQDKKRYANLQKDCLLWSKSLTWEKATEKSLALLNKVYEENNR